MNLKWCVVFAAIVVLGQNTLSSKLKSNNDKRERRSFLPGFSCPFSNLRFRGRPDIKFILHNHNFSEGVDISEDLGVGKLIPNAPIKVLIHGFLNNASSLMPSLITNAFMQRYPELFNVIIVDWSIGAGEDYLDYYTCHIPKRIVPLVAEGAFDFLQDMIKSQNINPMYIGLIGHSLGAQISARIGKKFIQLGTKLPIIVGLDPAKSDSPNPTEDERLTANDAEYVEVIHTNPQDLGMFRPLGTADFYPNYRRDKQQPGCEFDSTCSHSRAYQYYAESVANPTAFESVKCLDLEALKENQCEGGFGNVRVFMGGPGVSSQGKGSGIFYLKTNSKPPYGQY
ncbi:phospholipase A1 2-like [Culicoides brevitarsis]|uniref:phospholipase A1 2-like n=1 Tax=Culicoides brevitarsis TaxID=469753 RepID=UPI00307C02DD